MICIFIYYRWFTEEKQNYDRIRTAHDLKSEQHKSPAHFGCWLGISLKRIRQGHLELHWDWGRCPPEPWSPDQHTHTQLTHTHTPLLHQLQVDKDGHGWCFWGANFDCFEPVPKRGPHKKHQVFQMRRLPWRMQRRRSGKYWQRKWVAIWAIWVTYSYLLQRAEGACRSYQSPW